MTREFSSRIELDIRDSEGDWDAFLPDKAREGSPNVLVVLFDDTGQAAWSPYGGRIQMYSGDRLAFTSGTIEKVVFDVADDAYVDVEAHLAAAMARD